MTGPFGHKEIEITADGSATVYIPELDEHYHSVKGALAESKHVYVDCGFRRCDKLSVRLLEIGFGTGLNAVLTALNCENKTVEYISLELYPLDVEIVRKMRYGELLACSGHESANEIFGRIHSSVWGEPTVITPRFSLKKIKCDLTDPCLQLPENTDVVYFDAFAPEKQPEMWSEDVFMRIYRAMSEDGILTTYCAKGEIRRRLQSVGFRVERLSGPPAGKREILRAVKPNTCRAEFRNIKTSLTENF